LTNLDEALERFHLADLEYAGGLASHGPMGAEALESLGHHALIPAFLDLYVPRLPPAEVGRVMTEIEAESALGQIERRADWVATFDARLERGDWRLVLSVMLPDLLPGVFAGAGHGFLRTAHAVRSLEREDTPLRRRELARGLAYWCARFQRLPGLPGSRASSASTLDAFFGEFFLVREPAARVGLFFDAVKRLDSFPPFSSAIESITRPADENVESFLEMLCLASARLYCAHPESRIAYVHALTLPMALRGLLPYFESNPEANGKGQAALYVLQAVAALHCVYGDRDGSEESEAEHDLEVLETSKSWDEIRYRAACSIQEHSIKMAEACFRADRLSPDPIYRIAAADAALRIEGARGASGC
jgi:hypothetical protein